MARGRQKTEDQKEFEEIKKRDPSIMVGLGDFADALRHMLGLGRLYGGGRHRKKRDGEKGASFSVHDPEQGGRWVSRRRP